MRDLAAIECDLATRLAFGLPIDVTSTMLWEPAERKREAELMAGVFGV